jgi:hypothetical protein
VNLAIHSPGRKCQRNERGRRHGGRLSIEGSTQKSARGVHINDLADYIDVRRAAAIKEAAQLSTTI